MKSETCHAIGIPICILIYWVVHRLTTDWFIQGLAGVLLFGGLSIVGRILERKETTNNEKMP